ncbi:MAG: Crp/Fnr family transcriptional regulator [Saprospiraceae bacterium]|nr:Crp/Fnr family transcriptional regulator [Saprospiraceae bacterium]
MTSDHLDFFKKVVKKIDPKMPLEALEYLENGLQERKYQRNQLFLDPFTKHKEIGFLAEGLVRGYYINDKGEEITTRFNAEGSFVTDYSAFLNQIHSQYYFQCLESSSFLCFDYDYINEGYRKYATLERFGRLIAEFVVNTLENRLRSFHFLDAEKRYLLFMQQYPHLTNRVTIKHLSSYLGVTRPSLSRIRKKITDRPKR